MASNDPIHTSPELAARSVNSRSTYVPVDWVPLEPDTEGDFAALDKPLRGIRANTAGTVDVRTAKGDQRTMHFAAGETRWAVIVAIVSATATGLEGAV